MKKYIVLGTCIDGKEHLFSTPVTLRKAEKLLAEYQRDEAREKAQCTSLDKWFNANFRIVEA